MLIYTAAQKRGANTFSDEMAVYILLALGVFVDCFLVLGVELELLFLNHVSLFAKLLNSLAFCYINDHDLFMLIVFQYVLSRKKRHRQMLLFFYHCKYISNIQTVETDV